VEADRKSGLSRLSYFVGFNKSRKQNRFRGVKADQSAWIGQVNPSSIQTILSAPELRRVMPCFPKEENVLPKKARGLYHRSGIHCTVFSQCHPAPKVIIRLKKIITRACAGVNSKI